jgi:chitinase
VEHTFDGNVIKLFMEDAANGVLRSGAVAQMAAVPATFSREVRTLPMDVSTGAPPIPGGADYVRLFDRVMESLGSRTNEAYFVFAHFDINHVKAGVSLSSESDHAASNGQCLRYKLTRHF